MKVLKKLLFKNAVVSAEFIFLICTILMLVTGKNSESVRTLSVIFSSIILEAFPFMLVGALAGGIIEVFVKRDVLLKLLPQNKYITVCLAAGAGLVFPVCECAIVPVVRRMIKKGIPGMAAVAYLLGGPSLNLVVGASTFVAYNGFAGNGLEVMLLRMGSGYIIAVLVAFALGFIFDNRIIKTGDKIHTCPEHCEHTHHDEQGIIHSDCCQLHESESAVNMRQKLSGIFRHAADDFLSVAHFLVIGAFIAACAQTYIERSMFVSLYKTPFASSALMIVLAILLNLCSESDAFIAASFRGILPLHAQLAFMLTGPVFDLKLLLMYQNIFKKRVIAVISALILVAVAGISAGFEITGL